jgi:hypothetical protein
LFPYFGNGNLLKKPETPLKVLGGKNYAHKVEISSKTLIA